MQGLILKRVTAMAGLWHHSGSRASARFAERRSQICWKKVNARLQDRSADIAPGDEGGIAEVVARLAI